MIRLALCRHADVCLWLAHRRFPRLLERHQPWCAQLAVLPRPTSTPLSPPSYAPRPPEAHLRHMTRGVQASARPSRQAQLRSRLALCGTLVLLRSSHLDRTGVTRGQLSLSVAIHAFRSAPPHRNMTARPGDERQVYKGSFVENRYPMVNYGDVGPGDVLCAKSHSVPAVDVLLPVLLLLRPPPARRQPHNASSPASLFSTMTPPYPPAAPVSSPAGRCTAGWKTPLPARTPGLRSRSPTSRPPPSEEFSPPSPGAVMAPMVDRHCASGGLRE